jgi:hypothetical protein
MVRSKRVFPVGACADLALGDPYPGPDAHVHLAAPLVHPLDAARVPDLQPQRGKELERLAPTRHLRAAVDDANLGQTQTGEEGAKGNRSERYRFKIPGICLSQGQMRTTKSRQLYREQTSENMKHHSAEAKRTREILPPFFSRKAQVPPPASPPFPGCAYTLNLIWLMKMMVQRALEALLASLRSAWLIRRACDPTS